jgi:hypothetical protein
VNDVVVAEEEDEAEKEQKEDDVEEVDKNDDERRWEDEDLQTSNLPVEKHIVVPLLETWDHPKPVVTRMTRQPAPRRRLEPRMAIGGTIAQSASEGLWLQSIPPNPDVPPRTLTVP